MTVKTTQKCPCAHIWVNSGFDRYSYLPLKCSYSRRVMQEQIQGLKKRRASHCKKGRGTLKNVLLLDLLIIK